MKRDFGTQRRMLQALSIGGLGALALLSGCRQDMQNQPKFVPQRSTTFFADGRSARPQIEHTVARGQLREDSYYYTGLVGDVPGPANERDALPFPVTMQVLARGQERFNVYCTPCHSRVGNGSGMIVERGYKPAGNFHDATRLAQPLSHYFYVMTNGYGAMPDYSAQLTPEDRWAVAAYIRALQLSQNAKESDVPSGAKVQNLPDIAEQLGYPAGMAGPWALPGTAISAKPDANGGNAATNGPANGTGPQSTAPSKNKPLLNPPETTTPAAGKASSAKATPAPTATP